MANDDDDEIEEAKSPPRASSRKRARDDTSSKDSVPENRAAKRTVIPTDSRMEQKQDPGLYHANLNPIYYRGKRMCFFSSLRVKSSLVSA